MVSKIAIATAANDAVMGLGMEILTVAEIDAVTVQTVAQASDFARAMATVIDVYDAVISVVMEIVMAVVDAVTMLEIEIA